MTQLKKDKVRERIITEAAQLFGKFGYKKTSLDEIALAARKGKTSIYYYFKNKEAVFQAVVEREAETLRNELINSLISISDPVDKFCAYVHARMLALDQVANFYEAMKNELLDHLDFIDKIREEYNEEEVTLVKAILLEGNALGKFNIQNPDAAAITIVTALKGLEIPFFLPQEKINLEEKVNELLHLLIFGLMKR